MKNTPLRDIMTTRLIAVDVEEDLIKVNELFEKNHLHHILIVEREKLVGLVSLLDWMRISLGFRMGFVEEREVNENIYDQLELRRIMTENPVTMSPDDTVQNAALLFSENLFHAIPIEEDGRLVGIVTSTDVIKHLAGLTELVNR